MRLRSSILASLVCLLSAGVFGQTAEDLVAKNLQAKGGLEKIKAIKSIRMTGQYEAGGFRATVGQESKRPEMMRQTFTVQGMTQIQAYDGSSGWQISPFGGRKDPEALGEDDVRGLADLGEPLEGLARVTARPAADDADRLVDHRPAVQCAL